MKYSILTSILMAFALTGSAQCLDSLNFPNLQPPCNPDFIPVCGCDGNTYRNRCFADFATVLQYSEGPCDQIAIDLYPNPVIYWINLSVVTKYESDVNLFIFDRNGNINYYRYMRGVTSEMLTIPVNGFNQGLYIVMAESNGVSKLLKFIKWDE